jgi:hypothetical protein
MSENEQAALLDKIERRRRRRIIFRGIVAALCVLTLAIGAALVVGR